MAGTRGFIDSASIHGVVEALSYGKSEPRPTWTNQSAYEVTATLLTNDGFGVAPPPGRPNGTADETLSEMLSRLEGFRSEPPRSSSEAVAAAREKLASWVRENTAEVVDIVKRTREDESFEGWLDRARTLFWREHACVNGGLFSTDLIDEIALVLNCPRKELEQVQARTRRRDVIDRWAERAPNTREFELASNAYVIAALLRGRLHDALANADGRIHLLSHPFRQYVLEGRPETARFVADNSMRRLLAILVELPATERNPIARATLWAENLSLARTMLPRVMLKRKENDDAAIDEAVRVAKLMGLRTYSAHHKRLDRIFGLAAAAVSIKFAGLALARWVPADVLEEGTRVADAVAGAYVIGAADSLTSRVTGRRSRLAELTRAAPGRVAGVLGAPAYEPT